MTWHAAVVSATTAMTRKGWQTRGAGEGGMFQQAIQFAVIPLAKVLLMCGMGTLLSVTRVNVLTADARGLLSKLVFALFLPCLIFTQLGDALTTTKMLHWWFIPVNVLISAALGCFVGYLVALICRPPKEFFRFTVVMTGIANIGNIPLGIILSLCRDKKNPFGKPHECNQLGVAYLSFASWVGACLVYTVVYHLMAPPVEYETTVDTPGTAVDRPSHRANALLHVEGIGESEDTTPALTPQTDNNTLQIVHFSAGERSERGMLQRLASIPAVLWTDWPQLEEARSQHGAQLVLPLLDKKRDSNDDPDVESPHGRLCMAELRAVKKIRSVVGTTPLQQLRQPPIVASVLAIIVGAIPPLKGMLFGETAPFLFITDSLSILGNAMVPCILLVLGGNFIRSTGASRLGMRTTIGITFARLVVMPIIGLGVVLLADWLHWLPSQNRQMFRFVLLLQNTMPTSMLAAAMSSLRGYGENEASTLMLVEHICAIFTVAVFLAFYMQYLF